MSDSEPPVASPAPPPKPAKQTAASGPLPGTPAAKKKLPPAPIHMKLINLAIVGLLVFGALSYLQDERSLRSKTAVSASSQKETSGDDVPASVLQTTHPEDPRMARLITQDAFNTLGRVFSKIRAGVETRTLKAGDGRGVFCGQTITYREQSTDGTPIGGERILRLGDVREHTNAGIIWGLEGAQIGEIREIAVPGDFNTTPFSTARPQTDKHIIEILSATPEIPKAGEFPLRRFMEKGGAGYDLRCGDQAVAHLTIWSGQGKLLFSTMGGFPIYFEMGEGKGIPFGLELAAREMGPGGGYTVILPPELLKPLHAGTTADAPPADLEARPFPADLQLPENEVLVIDISFPQRLPMKQGKQETPGS